ncbi:MAG: hypothetical protein AAF518_18075 [Spirochaetota bacterium]
MPNTKLYTTLVFCFFAGIGLSAEEIYLPFPGIGNSSNTSSKTGENTAGTTNKTNSANNTTGKQNNTSRVEVSPESSTKKNNETGSSSSTNQVSKLPNLKDIRSKSKRQGGKRQDESKPPFDRARYYMNRVRNKEAVVELQDSIQKQGEFSTKAKLDRLRLLGMERDLTAAKSLLQGIQEEDVKYKAYFELAMALATSAKDKKQVNEAIPYYLKVLTEAPKTDTIVAKTLWALGNLHFRLHEYIPALDYLSLLILEHKNSNYIDDAYYLSGRIYQTGDTSVKNEEKARKYYQGFLQKARAEEKFFKDSIYLDEVIRRMRHL